jgi:Na+/melibiose symporter-like transporter
LAVLAFFGQVAWSLRSGGWPMALVLVGLLAIAGLILAWVYKLNQDAIRSELEPRRQELEALVRSLADESKTPGA